MDSFAWWPPLAAVLFFVGIWLVVTLLLSYISGWAFVARHYRAAQPFAGHYERMRASRMGTLGLFGGARNAVSVGIDPQGLHLRMFILFRLNCRELCIPWPDITVTRGKSWFVDFIELHFRRTPMIRLRIYGDAGEAIKALAGPAWPAEAVPDVVQR